MSETPHRVALRDRVSQYGMLIWWCERILHDVTAALCVTDDEILRIRGQGRAEARVARARAVTAWLLVEISELGWSEVGRVLGWSHDTVLRSHKRIADEIQKGCGRNLFALRSVLMHAEYSIRLLQKEIDAPFSGVER